MKDLGYKKAYRWVIENNPAIKLYERSVAVVRLLTRYTVQPEACHRYLEMAKALSVHANKPAISVSKPAI